MSSEIPLRLRSYLKELKKKTISLDEMSSLFGGDALYDEFADAIMHLIDLHILIPVKSAGYSSRKPRLPYKYKIHASILQKEYKSEIERLAIILHPTINLEFYFSQPPSVWDEDREDILTVDRYLRNNGLPEYPAGAPERSFQIFGDEKYIDEKYGKRLLQRLRLYDCLKIASDFDPAMFYLNIQKINCDQRVHKHLIIENRTPFYALSEIVHGSAFTSLLYGAGFNILASIAVFEKQIDLPDAVHQYLYFGDLDFSGISIWHYISEKVNALPALPFYHALLAREAAFGKEQQTPNMTALQHFLTHFDTPEQKRIQTILDGGQYYPQEALSKGELHQIFGAYFRECRHGL